MISSTTRAVLDLVGARSATSRTAVRSDARPHVDVAAEQDVVEHRHAVEQREVLERARDAEPGDAVRRQAGDVAARSSTIAPFCGG